MAPIRTTIAGSLPKPTWPAEPERLYAPWRLEGDPLREDQDDAVSLWLAEQDAAGIDIVTERVESAETVARRITAALDHVDADHLIACTDCGMVPRSRRAAAGKLRALAQGAALVNGATQ